MGRYEAEELYEGEYEAEERTRAAVSATPSYDDQFEDRTCSARESCVALEGLERSGERVRGRASSVAPSEIARQAFVAPAEIEGERSPAMRARRQSFLELEQTELATTPKRASYVAPAEIPPPPPSLRRSQVVRSERLPSVLPPPPSPPTPRGSRHSFVASSERNDFASSVPDAEEITSHRERPPSQPPVALRPQSQHPLSQRASQHPVSQRPLRASQHPASQASQRPLSQHPASHRRASQHPVSQRPLAQDPASHRRASQHPLRESTFAPAIESSEIEELVPKKSAISSSPAAEEQSRPIDYDALKRFLFDDVPPDSPEAAAMSPDDRSVSMLTPVATLGPRATHMAFRPAMHSIHPNRAEIAPAARISQNAFRPQTPAPLAQHTPVAPLTPTALAQLGHLPTMPQPMGPMGPMMQSVAPAARLSHHAFQPQVHPQIHPQMAMNAGITQDSYVDSSWIVPTPPFPSNAQASIRETGSFKMTLSFLAAAITAVAALAVMVAAIIFIRSEDAPRQAQATAALAAAEAPPKAADPVQVATPAVQRAAPAPAVAAAEKPATTTTAEKPAAEKPAKLAEKAEKPAAEKPAKLAEKAEKPAAEKPAKKKAAPAPAVAQNDGSDEAPAPKPTKKSAKSASDKSVEQMLADLGEEQLRR